MPLCPPLPSTLFAEPPVIEEFRMVTAAAMILGMAGFEKEVSVKMIRDFKDTHAGLLCRELLAESARKQIPRNCQV